MIAFLRGVIAAVCCGAMCCSALGFPQEAPTPFKTEVSLVNISAIVRSADGRLLGNLEKDDFELLEDGVPQTIRFFARENDLPLRLGLVIDASGSQEKFLSRHERDVQTFLNGVLRPSDQVFAICFGNHLRLISDSGSRGDGVIEAFKSFAKGSRDFPELGPREERELGTALFDAVYFSTIERLKDSGPGRRALIVFSDGEENSSEHDSVDAVQAAQNNDTFVYAVRYTRAEHGRLNARNQYGIRVMNHMAESTGASSFDALATDLDTVFTEIGAELRSVYQVGYVSTNADSHDGSFRKLTLRCKKKGAVVRTKSGYYSY